MQQAADRHSRSYDDNAPGIMRDFTGKSHDLTGGATVLPFPAQDALPADQIDLVHDTEDRLNAVAARVHNLAGVMMGIIRAWQEERNEMEDRALCGVLDSLEAIEALASNRPGEQVQ